MWNVVSVILEWTLTLLLYLLWLFIICLCLIVRVWAAYPRSKSLWITTGITLALVVLCVIADLIEPGYSQSVGIIGGSAGLSFFITATTAKIVEIANASTFLPQSEMPVDAVLHHHWWHMD